MSDERCDICDAEMKEYEVYDPESGKTVETETVCPNEHRHGIMKYRGNAQA